MIPAPFAWLTRCARSLDCEPLAYTVPGA
jgi:hypothetical protein